MIMHNEWQLKMKIIQRYEIMLMPNLHWPIVVCVLKDSSITLAEKVILIWLILTYLHTVKVWTVFRIGKNMKGGEMNE